MIQTGVGITNPLFFVGVVEENEDPRLEGRVKVRAFGIHGTNEQIPTEDLPWATLIIGSHDTNFVVPPLNSFVFGFFLDGRDAQQPMVLGLIPTIYNQVIDPASTGWGTPLGNAIDRASMSRRHEDIGQPTISKLARGENLEETYNVTLETNRVKNIEIAGGGAVGYGAIGNSNAWSQDTPSDTGASVPGSLSEFIKNEEGFSPTPYSDNSQTSIGYGTKALPGETSITMEEAERRLNVEIEKSRRYVLDMNAKGGYNWSTNQIDALTSFTYNLGPGGLRQLTENGTRDNSTIAENMLLYVNSGGKPVEGLIRRRQREQALFLSGDEGIPVGNGSAVEPNGYRDVSYDPGASSSWEEPASGYAAQYPYNRVIETPGGHVIELDSTQGAERIMIWHSSGSYIQMTPSTTSYKSSGDAYNINERNYHMYIGGTNIITIEGDSHVLVKGNKVEEIRGNYTQIVHGSISMGAANQININGGTETQIRSARLDFESNVENLNLKVGKKIVLSSGEGLHLKSKNIFIQGSEGVNLKGEDVFIETVGSINMKGETASFETSGSLSIKADHAIVGGGQLVSINASTVAIDDIVQMANGMAGSPTSAEGAADAEDASEVQMSEPPAPEISTTRPTDTILV
jgi:GH24 family phage-related lysozyme (muramidase)